MLFSDITILHKITSEDESVFEFIFRKYYAGLCSYSKRFVGDYDQAEELVQDVFLKLWESRGELKVTTSLKSYLFKSVHNKSLNYLKHIQVENKYKEYNDNLIKLNELSEDDAFAEPNMEGEIYDAIETLPEQCKNIFKLSRLEGLKYKEIAEQLNISDRTVEVQIRKASIILREKLKEYSLILLVFFTIFYEN